MRNTTLRWMTALSLPVLLATFASADEKKQETKEAAEEKVETVEVKVRDLTLNLPKTWKEVPSSSSMRLATYQIPPAGDDEVTGELTIFNFPGGGGDVGANLSRWVGQFESEGRTAENKTGKAGDREYVISTVSGTYNKPVGPPVLRQTEKAEGHRMINVILNVGDGNVYYLKLVGPEETIKAQEKAFRSAFGGDAETEKELEV